VQAQLVFGDDYQIGKSKVFLRPATYTRLEICKGERLRVHVVRMQRLARGFLARKKYVFNRRAAVKLQAFYRGYRARLKAYKWRRSRRAAKQLQRVARGYLVRKKCVCVCAAFTGVVDG
jgi:myosin heavy subunit